MEQIERELRQFVVENFLFGEGKVSFRMTIPSWRRDWSIPWAYSRSWISPNKDLGLPLRTRN